MSEVVFKRGPRVAGPEMPEGNLELAEPPVLGEPATADVSSLLTYLPMGLGGATMTLMYSTGSRGTGSYLMSGMMGASMMAMGLGQLGRNGTQRKSQMRAERRDYLRYLDQARRQARQAAEAQRAAAHFVHPHPHDLWRLAAGPRTWERRPGHDDFAAVRIGLGARRAALELVPPQTKPVEDLEPLCAISLRRFLNAYQTVSHLPLPLPLRRFTAVEFAGDGAAALGLARAIIGQLAVLHSPDDLRIALLADAEGWAEWQWLKWLPHNAHPTAQDATGPQRLAATDAGRLLDLLGSDVSDRPEHDPDVAPSTTEPFVVVIAQGVRVPDGSRLRGAGLRNVVLLDLTGEMSGGPAVLRLTSSEGRLEYQRGAEQVSADADALSAVEADTLARVLAPLRTAGTVDVDRPLESDFELTTLLGIRDPRHFDVAALWRPRSVQSARLRVPIGVSADGEVIELDLKESAQGGMGPHGLLIGATGSGKSELLRTLVIGLAATHSSEVLNFVLVDFKGGATFLHVDRLPHTAAVITNLADELHLVDRMRDSLNGEMVRRQELLRERGFASQLEYEKARLAGAPLSPLPSLLVIVDEFSELLASKPEFVDLFVSIGRLGRSLGVHLLLASQRLDEGRISKVEGHLSYRLALRTFSSMESRSVIGAAAAYELPSAPGNGYLKVDTRNLVRFKAAYVSGPVRAITVEQEPEQAAREVLAFDLDRRQPELPPEGDNTAPVPDGPTTGDPVAPEEPDSDDLLLEVLVNRLENSGPPARQVWLPPLAASPSLDQMLPGIVPDPTRGMNAIGHPALGTLKAPLGTVDRPHEQVRELLEADLSGAAGHVGIVGAPQTGKSTLLRTLILSLALTHTPEEIQFYCLDFGGGGIVSTTGLPHIGSLATRLDRDRVQRTVEELFQLLERRERTFTEQSLESMAAYRRRRAEGTLDDPHGDVFLVVDGWFTLRQDFEDLEARVSELAARGLAFGIHVIVSAVRWSEIRPRLRDLLGTKLELRLGDAMESEVGSRTARGVPELPGRGLTSGGQHFLAALPRLDSSSRIEDLTVATKSAVAEIAAFWPGRPAPPVRLLPADLPVRQLPAPDGDLRVCIGLDERRLEPVWHDFDTVPNLMVFGDGSTGKTNALRLVLNAITTRYQPTQAKIVLADPSRELLTSVPDEYRVGYAVESEALTDLAANTVVSMNQRLPGPDIPPDRIARRDWWNGPKVFVVVDDYDLFSGGGFGSQSPLAALVPLLAQGRAIGMHLIIARSTSGAMRATSDPVIRRMWELGTPALLFSYPKEEGKFLGEAKPRTLPPGRAQLVTRRSLGLVHTGHVPPP